MYTKQQTFNKVARHLMRMTEPSVDASGEVCAYRGTGGRSCAVGVLIPDCLYTKSIEGLGLNDMFRKDRHHRLEALVQMTGHDVELCRHLQLVHDDHFRNREFALECLAEKHGLKMPEFDNA